MTNEDILNLYRGPGSMVCDGDGLTHVQHAWQCARLAERAGASDALKLAAWLHDVGHLLGPQQGGPADHGRSPQHELHGGKWLCTLFGDAVGMPVQLHVQAKRFLVAVHPVYHDRLSAGSKRSLATQGGAMDLAQCQAFRSDPWADDALRLRIWDDIATMKDWAPADWAPSLAELMRRVAAGGAGTPATPATKPGRQPFAQVVKDASNARAAAQVFVPAQPDLERYVHLVAQDAVQIRS